jgi:hypothetical protein
MRKVWVTLSLFAALGLGFCSAVMAETYDLTADFAALAADIECFLSDDPECSEPPPTPMASGVTAGRRAGATRFTSRPRQDGTIHTALL